jgi:hypothetical protein
MKLGKSTLRNVAVNLDPQGATGDVPLDLKKKARKKAPDARRNEDTMKSLLR